MCLLGQRSFIHVGWAVTQRTGDMKMSRTRLTDKTASEAVNDVYLNESRTEGNKNVPMSNGTPDGWNETPVGTAETARLHTDDMNRDESNIVAIKKAADLESRAVKCLVASQRMLPGADRNTLEANALDLMHLPTASIDGMLFRQEGLARSIAASANKIAEDCATPEIKADEVKEVAAAVEAPVAPVAEEAAKEDQFAKMASQIASLTGLVEKLAAKKKKDEEEDEEEDKPGKPKKGVNPFAKKASEDAALEGIFAPVTASASKSGAASVSGMVHTAASNEENVLASLWAE